MTLHISKRRPSWLVHFAFAMLAAIGPAWAELSLSIDDPDLAQRLTTEARVLNPDDDATAADRIAAAKGDYARLLAVLYEAGYFGANISITLNGREAANLSALTSNPNIEPVRITVDPGRLFTFGQAIVAPLPPNVSLPAEFQPGATAGTPQIRRAARDAITAWRENSHAKAQVADQSISAQHATAQINASIRIDPGPALRFGNLVTPNDTSVRSDRIRTIAGLPTGQPFHPDEVERARERLIDTGAFQSVVVEEAEEIGPDQTLDILLSVQDAAPRRIGFGAEVSTQDGISLEAFWLHRNIFGGAERLRFDLDIDGIAGDTGGVDYSVGATLTIPGFKRADDQLILEIAARRLDEETYDGEQFEASVRREREVNDKLTLGLGAGLRFSDVTDVFGDRSFQHVLLFADAEFDNRDNTLSPTKGYFANLSFTPFIGFSDSATGLLIASDLRAYRSVRDGTVFASRLQLSSVVGSDLSETPPGLLFFSGGGGTVRGQDFQSLGVELPNGRTGGRSFIGLSTEVRQDITNTIGIVGFVDFGFVSADSDFSDGESHSGIGLGARYKTSLGALRFDIGLPLTGEDDGGFDIYIGIGEAF
ncbi:MAG: BamA/TamA family outer membrane protein [Paracoccaceae bacterium]